MTFDFSLRKLRFAAVAAALLGAPFVAHAADEKAEHWAVIEKYCFDCHNTTDWAGGIAFDTMSMDDIPSEAETWEKAIRRLRGRLMPPPGKPQPANEQFASLVGFLENSLDTAAAGHAHVGRVGLHRLNRREYANAVKDLLALDIDAASMLPRDEAHDGFDNIATALQVSPSFMDQYLGAAHKVAAQAMGNPTALRASAFDRVRRG